MKEIKNYIRKKQKNQIVKKKNHEFKIINKLFFFGSFSLIVRNSKY